jgi:hypothetical protein
MGQTCGHQASKLQRLSTLRSGIRLRDDGHYRPSQRTTSYPRGVGPWNDHCQVGQLLPFRAAAVKIISAVSCGLASVLPHGHTPRRPVPKINPAAGLLVICSRGARGAAGFACVAVVTARPRCVIAALAAAAVVDFAGGANRHALGSMVNAGNVAGKAEAGLIRPRDVGRRRPRARRKTAHPPPSTYDVGRAGRCLFAAKRSRPAGNTWQHSFTLGPALPPYR